MGSSNGCNFQYIEVDPYAIGSSHDPSLLIEVKKGSVRIAFQSKSDARLALKRKPQFRDLATLEELFEALPGRDEVHVVLGSRTKFAKFRSSPRKDPGGFFGDYWTEPSDMQKLKADSPEVEILKTAIASVGSKIYEGFKPRHQKFIQERLAEFGIDIEIPSDTRSTRSLEV